MQLLEEKMAGMQQEIDEAIKSRLSAEMDLQGAKTEMEEAQLACQTSVADHEETKLKMAELQEKYDEARLAERECAAEQKLRAALREDTVA